MPGEVGRDRGGSAQIFVDTELCEVWPCGPHLYEVVARQVNSLVEIDLEGRLPRAMQGYKSS